MIALVATLTLLAAVGGTVLAGSEYSSSATLRVPSGNAVSESVGQDDLQYTDRLINTYQRIGESLGFRHAVERRVPDARKLRIKLTPEANTELVELTARSVDRGAATRAANVAADLLIDRVRGDARLGQEAVRTRVTQQLENLETSLTQLRDELTGATDPSARAQLAQRIRVQELRYEALAQQAASLDLSAEARQQTLLLEQAATEAQGGLLGPILRRGLLALLFGLAAGTGLVLLLERRSPQLSTVEEVEAGTKAEVLATIPSARHVMPAIYNGQSPQHNAFSSLRTRLLLDGTTSVLIISAQDGDGKSTVAVNLAAAMAHADRRVLLIDAHVRHPAIHHFLQIDNDRGLADVLASDEPVYAVLPRMVVTTRIPNLDVLTSGRDSAKVAALLATARMTEVLAAAELLYDNIVIDSSSLDSGEAGDMASQVEEFLWVIGEMPVPHELVTSTRRQLAAFRPQKVGVIVNRASDNARRERATS